MTLYTDTFKTSLGQFSVAVAIDGAVIATAFGSLDALRARLRDPARATQRPRQAAAADTLGLVPDRQRTAVAREQVLAYAAGTRRDFNVPLRPDGTEFQRRVWAALAEIPCGETRTYAQLASRVGSAPRAVGQANARNPICLLLPCHRVIGADGTLTGFAFGTALKERLLAHERSGAETRGATAA